MKRIGKLKKAEVHAKIGKLVSVKVVEKYGGKDKARTKVSEGEKEGS